MPGPGKIKSLQRDALIKRTAAIEQLIAQISLQQKAAAAYHVSELAERSLANADSAIAEAVKSLSLNHLDRVERLLNVAWFYTKFSQDIVTAEATEHLLGNDRFLDLIEPTSKVQTDLRGLLQSLSEKLDALADLIPQIPEI